MRHASVGEVPRPYSGGIPISWLCEPCIDVKDSACADVCPVDCIYPHADETPDEFEAVNQLYIHPEECIDCDVCTPECPVEAIFMDDDVPEEWVEFIEINAAYFE